MTARNEVELISRQWSHMNFSVGGQVHNDFLWKKLPLLSAGFPLTILEQMQNLQNSLLEARRTAWQYCSTSKAAPPQLGGVRPKIGIHGDSHFQPKAVGLLVQ